MVMKKAAKVKKSAKKAGAKKSLPFGGKQAMPFAKGGGRKKK